jgi:hypothetical protein
MQILKNIRADFREVDGVFFSPDSQNLSYPSSGFESNYRLEQNSCWYAHRTRIIVDLVNRYNKGEEFFDLGGGNGYVAKALQDSGIESILREPGEQGACNAKDPGVKQAICSTLKGIKCPASLIGSIGTLDLMEDIEDDSEFLEEINHCLKDSGLLYLTVPACQFLFSSIDWYAGYFRRYILGSLEKLQKTAGFEIEFKTYFFSMLPLPIFLFRIVPQWLSIRPSEYQIDTQSRRVHQKEGIKATVLNKTLDWEYQRIVKHSKIRFGSSVLLWQENALTIEYGIFEYDGIEGYD